MVAQDVVLTAIKLIANLTLSQLNSSAAADGVAADAADAGVTGNSGCLLYTVQTNDTGYNIAKSFGLDFPLINASNPNVVWEKIKVGEAILIPTGFTSQPEKNVAPAPSCPSSPAAGSQATSSPAVAPSASSAADEDSELPEDNPDDASPAASIPTNPPAATSPTPPAANANTPAGNSAGAGTAAAGTAPSAANTQAPNMTSAAAGTAAAAKGAPAPATSGCKSVVVAKGDTGYQIATKNGLTMAQLNAQNPGMVWEKMQVGQTLLLPPSANGTGLASVPDCKPAVIIPAQVDEAGSSGAAPVVATNTSKPVTSAPAASTPAPASNIASASPAATSSPPASSPPASKPASSTASTNKSGAEPVSALLSISPSSKSCDDAKFKDECATATDAAPHIVSSFAQYNVTSAGEQAALISWMIFESAGFKYNKNHFPAPGRPGQGTRTMMMPEFVQKYAKSIKALNGPVGTDEQVLALVMVPEYTFGSAAWFHSSQCSEGVKKGLAEGTTKGWEAWLKECVQTEVGEAGPDGRREIYDRARKALGVSVV
ncbi:uncharacterized protein HMPREF1541_08073 [Cyphellophora europaea CBS 101466]|uniref:LysM domain-containing protein n=1 Tax=Cyphellophora europaea (strain CBS 101466) TaxID=1220924 RepID=W2RN02_CYPE1|nr:uncharacterized protein HMPREF1541_08073 [Cyphellophora europaea CBS 101466]ETN37083.1 hypothetical protein HMPREF1541_08073 [Cyphellophora europaea CBS 101466]